MEKDHKVINLYLMRIDPRKSSIFFHLVRVFWEEALKYYCFSSCFIENDVLWKRETIYSKWKWFVI